MFTGTVTSSFRELFASLKMRDSFGPATVLIGKHLEDVQRLLSRFLHEDPAITPDLRSLLTRVPTENLARLVVSPYLCEFLLLAQDPDAEVSRSARQQVVQALVAEVRRVQPGLVHPLLPPWTIDGDEIFDPDLKALYPPLRTACGIALNYQSAVHNTAKQNVGGYAYGEALKHKERIETAKNIVGRVSPAAYSLVDLFTTTIQFRNNLQRPSVVNSSTHSSIGLIRCDNFHKLHGDLPEVVDLLVHESIHQYLHLFEEQIAAFVQLAKIDPLSLGDRIYPSPWSGNLLDLRSYTHAILVWYGLAKFWQQVVDADREFPGLTRLQARTKLVEARVGFMNGDSVLDNLRQARAWLNPEYVVMVETLKTSLVREMAHVG